MSGGHTHGVHIIKPHVLLLPELSGAVSESVKEKIQRTL